MILAFRIRYRQRISNTSLFRKTIVSRVVYKRTIGVGEGDARTLCPGKGKWRTALEMPAVGSGTGSSVVISLSMAR